MLSITLDLGKAPSVLAALADQRMAQLVANAAAESYVDDTLDYIAAGKAFTPRNGGAGLEGAITWHSAGNGAAEIFVLDRVVERKDPDTGRVQKVNFKDYGRFVEFGTQAHVIRPKPDRKGVKMPVPGGAGFVVRREFNHPGSKPHPFFFADLDARKDHMQARALSVLAARMAQAGG